MAAPVGECQGQVVDVDGDSDAGRRAVGGVFSAGCAGAGGVVAVCSVLMIRIPPSFFFFFSSRRRHTSSVSAFLLNRSSDLDPVLYGNLPPREISMKDVFRSGDSSKKFKIAEGQWYRYAPSYVSPAYHLLEGFPFIQEPP